MNYISKYKSPLGEITIASDGQVLTGAWFNNGKYFGETLNSTPIEKDLPIFHQTKKWFDIYFSGIEPSFMPAINLSGSEFRLAVWEILKTIPYGQTTTYGEISQIIAKQRGLSKMSAQAVGGAIGHNPISIIIPCHRVIASNGNLTGYAGGLERKIKLLKLENIIL